MWKRIYIAILPSCHKQSHVGWTGCLHRDTRVVQALHNILQVSVQIPEPLHWRQLCLFMEDMLVRKLHRSISKAKVVCFFLFTWTLYFTWRPISVEMKQLKGTSSLVLVNTYPSDSSRKVLLPSSGSSSKYLKNIGFNMFCFIGLKRRCCSKHFTF